MKQSNRFVFNQKDSDYEEYTIQTSDNNNNAKYVIYDSKVAFIDKTIAFCVWEYISLYIF